MKTGLHEHYLLALDRWLSLFFKGKRAPAKKVAIFNMNFRMKHRGPKMWRNRDLEHVMTKLEGFGAKPSYVRDQISWIVTPNEIRQCSRSKLEDPYIRSLLEKTSGVSAKKIPTHLVEAKRGQIEVQRLIRRLSK